MRLLVVAVVLSLAGLAHADTPLRVLFIGNSLTYTNDLPAMVERIAAADGRRVITEMIALRIIWEAATGQPQAAPGS